MQRHEGSFSSPNVSCLLRDNGTRQRTLHQLVTNLFMAHVPGLPNECNDDLCFIGMLR